MKLKIKFAENSVTNELPKYATPGSAGFDLQANITETIVLFPGERIVVPTGLKMEIPIGFEGQVRPRSGIAAKHGITVLNSPGTIDSDYRGEVGVIIVNHSNDRFVIKPLDRIAQMVFARYERAKFEIETELSTTERGEGGFGSTN